MNLEKSTKRIAKRVKKGFQGYPQVILTYFGETQDCATKVVVEFMPDAEADVQEQKFISTGDTRNDEVIQTTLLKIIERAEAKTVVVNEGIRPLV